MITVGTMPLCPKKTCVWSRLVLTRDCSWPPFYEKLLSSLLFLLLCCSVNESHNGVGTSTILLRLVHFKVIDSCCCNGGGAVIVCWRNTTFFLMNHIDHRCFDKQRKWRQEGGRETGGGWWAQRECIVFALGGRPRVNTDSGAVPRELLGRMEMYRVCDSHALYYAASPYRSLAHCVCPLRSGDRRKATYTANRSISASINAYFINFRTIAESLARWFIVLSLLIRRRRS